jgi:hypothetical protein
MLRNQSFFDCRPFRGMKELSETRPFSFIYFARVHLLYADLLNSRFALAILWSARVLA